MISSQVVKTSITLLVVSFLIWAWPAKGPGQVLEEASANGAISSVAGLSGVVFDQELSIIDNGLETKVDLARGEAAMDLGGRPLAANSSVGLLGDAGSRAVSVENFLKELGYKVAPEDIVFPARAESVPRFGRIIIRRAPGVVIRHDDKKEKVKTRALSVKQLLAEKKIKVGKDDRVEPDLTAKIVSNMEVRVIRVEFKQEESTEDIAFETETRDDSSSYVGTQSIKVAGVVGEKTKKFKITLEDGKEVKRDLLKEEITKEPVTQVVLRGTKKRPAYQAPSGGGDYWDLINAAAAKYGVSATEMHSIMICESGGNPQAFNGYNIGLFQFEPGTFARWNIFPGANIWDAKAQIYAAANLLGHGGRGSWGC